MKLIKSNIFTGRGYVQYLLLDNARIAYVGNDKPSVPVTHNWSGYYIYPGFIDSHTHILWHGLNLIRCSLNNAENAEDIYSRVKAYDEANPHLQFIIAEGFDETKFTKQGLPKKAVLDTMFPDKPVLLRRICGHAAVLNEKAYRMLEHGLDLYNSSTGLAKEGAILKLNSIFAPSDIELRNGFAAAEKDMFSKGITGVGDMCTEDSLTIFKNTDFNMDIRFYFPYTSKNKIGNWNNRKNVKLNGLKMFTDGSIGSYTAALSVNYRGTAQKGTLLLDEKEIKKTRIYAENKGLQLAVHAIGDRAIQIGLNALDEGHRIEHFELATHEQIDEAEKKGIILSMQPNFLGNWAMKGQMYEKRLPAKIYRFNNAIGHINEKNIRLGLGSDCMPVSPMYGIASLADAEMSSQKLPPFESVRLYSEGSADICSMKNRGRLSRKFYSDFIVCDSDIAHISLEKQPNILYTYKNGTCVYNKEEK